MFHVWNLIRWVSYSNRSVGRSIEGVGHFLYNGRKVRIITAGGRGWQSSIFNDEILGKYHLEFGIELGEEEKAFLYERYSNLSNGQMADFQKMLSHIRTGEMVPFYIMRYGFYEGHTGYRADPIAISLIFGLRSLEEIEKAVEPFIRALEEKNIKKRRAAAWALEKIPSDKAVKPLIAALKDADDEVRMWAAEALKRIGTSEALKAVEKYENKTNFPSIL